VDREGALDAAGRPVERLPHSVAQDALRQAPVDPGKTLGRAVVDRENEAEVDRVPKTAAVIHQGLADRLLVASEGTVSLTDAVQLAALSPAQSLLAVGDVADLAACPLGAVVVRASTKNISGPHFLTCSAGQRMQISFRLRDGLLPFVGPDGADFGEQFVLAHLHSPTLDRPMRQEAQHP
jgi:hypothetical protein